MIAGIPTWALRKVPGVDNFYVPESEKAASREHARLHVLQTEVIISKE